MTDFESRLKAALEEENRKLDPFYKAVTQLSDAISSVNNHFFVTSEYHWDGWHNVYLNTRDISLDARVALFSVDAKNHEIKYNDGVVKRSSANNLASDMADVFLLLRDIQKYVGWMRVWSDNSKR